MRPSDQIKEKLDIAQFIGEYLELKPAGKNLKGLCPFHGEKSPSFVVSPDRQIWHCFGCGVGGDVFGFLMQYENIEFIEALRALAEKTGVSLGDYASGDQKKYDRLYEINRIAVEFFATNLQKPDGAQARKYLESRGMKEVTVAEFNLGYAGSGNDALTTHLLKMGYTPIELEKAGISFKTRQGTYWDRFRNRIMFPLYNQFGKPVGFTGRIMPGHEMENTGKYVNSPETLIFSKSKVLYGLDRTRKFIRDTETAIVVEGQMDVILSWQDNVKNIVASSGTAITNDHINALQKIAEKLVLVFDNDNAGRLAAERTIDLAQSKDFNTFVVLIEGDSAKDPADIVRAQPGKLAEYVQTAIPAMKYYFHKYQLSANLEITAKKKAIREILSKIERLKSPVERMHWIKELAILSGMEESIILQELNILQKEAKKTEPKAESAPNKEADQQKRVDKIVQRILALLVEHPKFKEQIEAQTESFPKRYQAVVQYLVSETKRDADPEIAGLINSIYLRSGLEESKTPEKEFSALFSELKKERKSHQTQGLKQQIKQAEKAGDTKKLKELLENYSKIHQGD